MMDRYSIEEIGVGVPNPFNAKYVIFKNVRDIAYCKSWSEAVATLAIIKLSDRIFSDVLRTSYIGYEL